MKIYQKTQQIIRYKHSIVFRRKNDEYFMLSKFVPVVKHSHYILNIPGASLDFNSPSYSEGLF